MEQQASRPNRIPRDLGAGMAGAILALALFLAFLALRGLLSREECSGEHTPFLGSARQTFEVYGCLHRDAGPLIALKKRLGIYDPAWKLVIK